jgi:hypothetical protein
VLGAGDWHRDRLAREERHRKVVEINTVRTARKLAPADANQYSFIQDKTTAEHFIEHQ